MHLPRASQQGECVAPSLLTAAASLSLFTHTVRWSPPSREDRPLSFIHAQNVRHACNIIHVLMMFCTGAAGTAVGVVTVFSTSFRPGVRQNKVEKTLPVKLYPSGSGLMVSLGVGVSGVSSSPSSIFTPLSVRASSSSSSPSSVDWRESWLPSSEGSVPLLLGPGGLSEPFETLSAVIECWRGLAYLDLSMAARGDKNWRRGVEVGVSAGGGVEGMLEGTGDSVVSGATTASAALAVVAGTSFLESNNQYSRPESIQTLFGSLRRRLHLGAIRQSE